jgi:predicted DCC family thiol-disulfide oxidoreductase YuxK
MNIVLFDGVCNLCNSTVLFLIKHDVNNQLKFSAQQTEAGKNIMLQNNIATNNSSVIFIKETKVYDKSDAIIEISKLLTGWPSILKYGKIFPKWLRNFIYDLIAKNRYRIFGKRNECAIPSEANKVKFL